MKKMSLEIETLVVESFAVEAGASAARGTVRGMDAAIEEAAAMWTNLSQRPCTRCCPEP